MNEISESEILENGVPLAKAYRHFAPKRMQRLFSQQEAANIFEGRQAIMPEAAEKPRPTIMEMAKSLGWVEPEVASEMRDHLLAEIRRGGLKAYGVPERPEPRHDYVEIPPAMLEPHFVKWKKGRIEDRHFAFRSVQVLQASSRGNSRPGTPRAAKKESLGERRRRLVIEAYRQLPEAVRMGKSQKSKIAAVQKFLVRDEINFKNGRGLSDERIREHLQSEPGF